MPPIAALTTPPTIDHPALLKTLGGAYSTPDTNTHMYPVTPVEHSDETDHAQGHSGNNISPHLPLSGRRPASAIRPFTDPPSSAPAQTQRSSSVQQTPPSTQRNRSPYSRSHLRSRSSGTTLSAPLKRAHSSPGITTTARTFDLPPTSARSAISGTAMHSPARQRSPFKPQEEQNYNATMRASAWHETSNNVGAIESIEEDRELELTPRQPHQVPASTHTQLGRSSSLRRRPASPLHSGTVSIAPTAYPSEHQPASSTSQTTSGSNSPFLAPQRYNETYPSLRHYASSSSFSSMPSTPTSQRSRSPSISSLDTIEDAPDLEGEAIEAERIERLKLAAEREERAESGEEADEPSRRSSLDVPRGFGFMRGGNREKKRWSVCGGERRADLDLETIWED